MKLFISSLAALTVAVQICSAQKHSLICPVTRLTIPSEQAAVAKSRYHGKTYYFCTTNCKRLFDQNPAKYAGGKKSKHGK